jgi:hypothetical protein
MGRKAGATKIAVLLNSLRLTKTTQRLDQIPCLLTALGALSHESRQVRIFVHGLHCSFRFFHATANFLMLNPKLKQNNFDCNNPF